MKIQSFLLLFSSTSLVWGSKCPQAEGENDAQIIERFKVTGECFDYVGVSNNVKSVASCVGPDGYCQKVKHVSSEGAGCKPNLLMGNKPEIPRLDEDCNQWYPGECACSDLPETVDTPDKRSPGKTKPKVPVTPPKTPPKTPTTPNTRPKNPAVSKPPTNSKTVTKSKTSSSAPAGTRGAACMYCGEGSKKDTTRKTPTKKPGNAARDDKFGAMFARATTPNKPGQKQPATKQPVCIKQPASDRTEKRSTSEVARDLIFPRALSEKNSKVATELGRTGQYKWTCSVGKYAPTSMAEGISDITKYWTFQDPSDPDKCSVEVGRVTKDDVGPSDTYETDHVYEAQTLANFITWLADESGNIGTTYKKPTADWVEKQLLGEGPFRIVSPGNTNPGSLYTPTSGEIPVVLMAYGFGRSDGVESISGGRTVQRVPKERGNKNLVLLDSKINGPKGIWFTKKKPDSDWKTHTTQLAARLEVRRAVGPFKYLAAREGTVDTMWKKWARVSNWIDLVCHTFDQQYQWGTNAGEPTNLPGKTGQVSLRSIYAFFIDKELREIEEKAAVWARDAAAGFEARWVRPNPRTPGVARTPLTQAERDWKTAAFGPNGYATAARMTFPRPGGLPAGSGDYGAYGWGHAGNDARGVDPAIGTPTRIT